jgi:hypothetical protein
MVGKTADNINVPLPLMIYFIAEKVHREGQGRVK